MPSALITGATAGIGAAFARRLASEGFDLVLVARDARRLEMVAGEHRERHGVHVEVLPADLATDDGIADVEARLADGVDLLVNNAGVGQQGEFRATRTVDELAMLRLHCEAVLRLTKAALPPMLHRKHGQIINVASVAAFFSRGTYSASKAWVVTFSDSIRNQLTGTGVHVMALCPGWVRTEFHERSGMSTEDIPSFLWIDAGRLVSRALRDARRGVAVSIPGVSYKILVGLAKVLPRSLTTRLSARAGSHH